MGEIDIFCFLESFLTENDSSLERKIFFKFLFFFHNIIIILKKLCLKKFHAYLILVKKFRKSPNSQNLFFKK